MGQRRKECYLFLGEKIGRKEAKDGLRPLPKIAIMREIQSGGLGMENKRAEMLFFFCKKVLNYTHNRRIIVIARRKQSENKRPD